MNILRLIVSIVIPPLGVFWQVGFTGQFWLNVILTLIGYIPGLVHAAFIIFTRD
ncbi:MAG: YqaE/Pmp3 family membrane protein [Rubrobacter sp.]|nr:YqaE/Pmp3 family membrane protein [Rubrobacter sp.]